jgi:para-aminobenzoate synthetase component I
MGAVNPKPCVSLSLPWRDPLIAFAPFVDEDYAMLLGPGSKNGACGQWSILLARPDAIYEGNGKSALQNLPPLPPADPATPLPFVGGYAGLLSYELGAALDRVPRLEGGRWPDLSFGYYPCAALFDHFSRSLWVVGPDDAQTRKFSDLLGNAALPALPPLAPVKVERQTRRSLCLQAISNVIALIHAGDIFQANISQGFHVALDPQENAFSYFRRLCEASPAPYRAYFRANAARALVSNSPEQFITVLENRRVQTSPIKGTRPRADDPAQDSALAEALLSSTKDRAENLMIVDLMRNDISRICQPGSVTVPTFCDLQSFANVHHLVSTVEGHLHKDANAQDMLSACFPAGSITGAPKIRAMEIIAQIERQARGPYCGSLGYISRHGRAAFNVLIRSAEILEKQSKTVLEFRTGGGIVADSNPIHEYQEMMDKAKALCRAAGAEL